MKTITNIISPAFTAIALACFALSPVAQATPHPHPTPTPTPTPSPMLADSGVPSTMREFMAPGVTTFTVPTGVVRILIEVWGAGGGGGDGFCSPPESFCSIQGSMGGAGAYSRAVLNVAAGDTVYVTVGQGGSAYGGAGSSSSVRDGNTVITSGGGGGAGNATEGCYEGAQGSPGTPDPQASIGRSSASRYGAFPEGFYPLASQPEPGTVQPRGGFGGRGADSCPGGVPAGAGANGYVFIQW
jgi:hypothetical protein